ncbi:protein GrpE [Virgisporangium aliadipatigenens]|uniref:Protein GrpE n=1 Tax=Virgisporangium aliadipatigenens TaxID=741659 RepID=A0A8J3YQH6_9ACTN|nr:nucleotide exchange factor GrpE [Virgisporangium aliadipatigenens]GIJ49576.1 protein GrpE [Virgisporangium aliadipatigenens]
MAEPDPAPIPSTERGAPDTAARHAAPGAGTGAPDGDVAKLHARIAELEDLWRRALADFDNLRKRVARDTAAQQDQERARLAAQWLPVLDNLDLAVDHAQSDPDSIVEGVRAIREQALAVLARLGFPRQSDVGEKFDPSRHEAVATIPSPDAPAGTVVHVVRPRYGTDDHQLRPAAVVVAKDS